MAAIPNHPRDSKNLLLSLLPEQEYRILREHLEFVHTPLHFKLFERDKPIRYAYFPCSGEHSILATTASGQAAEVGTVGFEGFSTVDLMMEADTASETTICQIAGDALRLPAAQFKALPDTCPELRRICLRYLQA